LHEVKDNLETPYNFWFVFLHIVQTIY